MWLCGWSFTYFHSIFAAYFGYSIWPSSKTKSDDKAALSTFDYCKYYECCTNTYIRYDINALKKDLDEHLFGQHIANATILPALYSHHKNMDQSQKPLVMSFHGTPGTGKNYVADRIVKHLYRLGDQSKYVHKFMGRVDFPLASKVEEYRVSQISIRNFSEENLFFGKRMRYYNSNCYFI